MAIIICICCLISGVLIGKLLGKFNLELPYADQLMTVAVFLLVLLMGIRIGGDDEVFASLDTIGLQAFVITIFVQAFALIGLHFVRKALGFDRYGERHSSKALLKNQSNVPKAESENKPAENTAGSSESWSMTIMISAAVAAGIASGRLFIPAFFVELAGNLITSMLYALLVLIGISMAYEKGLIIKFKTAGLSVLYFPLVIIAGSLIGAMIASLFMPISLKNSLCVAAGLGWYSLAPAMLATYSTTVSAISFMHNVTREIVGILFMPIVARKVGYIECMGLAAAASMDSCLPIVLRLTRNEMMIYSFINGLILSTSVPIMEGILIGL